LELAGGKKRIRFVRTDTGERQQPSVGNIKVLSSCQHPTEASDLEPALLLSYTLASDAGVKIRLRRSVCQTLINHCGQSRRHGFEVAGVLAGYQRQVAGESENSPQYCLDVTDVLPIDSSDRSSSHIRVDEQSWGTVERALLELSSLQGKCKLAWYHTHPTQGISFSRGDWDAHALFSRPYQFALVVDPSSMQAGLFYWSDYDRKLQGRPRRFSLKQEVE